MKTPKHGDTIGTDHYRLFVNCMTRRHDRCPVTYYDAVLVHHCVCRCHEVAS